jgi:hypothetical protein
VVRRERELRGETASHFLSVAHLESDSRLFEPLPLYLHGHCSACIPLPVVPWALYVGLGSGGAPPRSEVYGLRYGR